MKLGCCGEWRKEGVKEGNERQKKICNERGNENIRRRGRQKGGARRKG